MRTILVGYVIVIVFWTIGDFYCSVLVSWAVENNLVYFWWSMIVIVSWAIENNLVYFRGILVRPLIEIVFWSYPPVGL